MNTNILGTVPTASLNSPVFAKSAQPVTGSGVELVPASEIPMLPVLWLWKFWLARGKFHILAGPPSTGKTTLALSIAATLTIGGTWPDGSAAPKGSVVVWTCEDGIEDTIKPRLIAAGADQSRILVLCGGLENGRRRPFDFARDMPGLETAIRARGDVVLVIIDSIAHAVPASNNNSRVRQALDPLVELADRAGCAILGLTHVNKGAKKKSPLERVNGSVAIGALSRIAWIVARDESRNGEAAPCSVLVRAKSNIGPVEGGFSYHIDAVDIQVDQASIAHSSKVAWDGALEGSPREILVDAEGGSAGREDRKEQAANFLTDVLATGPKPTNQIEQLAKDVGLSWATVRRASDELGVKKFRPAGEHRWLWSLDGGTSSIPLQGAGPVSVTGLTPLLPIDHFSLHSLPSQSAQVEQHAHVEQVSLPRDDPSTVMSSAFSRSRPSEPAQAARSEDSTVAALIGFLIPQCATVYQTLPRYEPEEEGDVAEDEVDFQARVVDEVLNGMDDLSKQQENSLRDALLAASPWIS